MEKEILLKQLRTEFSKMKEDMKFKTTFEELDKAVFVSDLILKEGFVSPELSRQISHRIADLYGNWAQYLHSIIMPNPQNILNLSESRLFTQEDRKEINEMMSQAMELSSRNSLVGLTKDKKAEAKFIDDSIALWNNTFEKKLAKMMEKVNTAWKGDKK